MSIDSFFTIAETSHDTKARRSFLAFEPSDGDLACAVSLLFILPNAILAASFQWPVMALVWAGCAGAVVAISRARKASPSAAQPADIGRLALCLGFGFALCLLGGEGHFFYTPRDWLVRDAVLADLVRSGANVLYRDSGADYMLRAPLGAYLVPSLVGRMAGLSAAHVAFLFQNAMIVGVTCYFIATIAQDVAGRARKAALLLVFIGFSGLDAVPLFLAEANELLHGEPFMPFHHTEWWGLYFSPIRMQYSSHVSLIFWAMNHMAPGWWFAILSLLYVRRIVPFATLLVSFAAMLLWSPLAMMGAAPILAFFALELLSKRSLRRDDLVAIGGSLSFLPIAFYLTIDNGGVAKEWLVLRDGFFARYLLHLAFEIPQAAIVLYAWRMVEPCDRRIVALALGLLAIFPVYSIGLYNDFTMRASIAPLFVLSYVFARIAVSTPRDGGRFASAISTVVLISAATPLVEARVALTGGRFEVSDCNFLTAWRKNEPTAPFGNYLAHAAATPAWLMRPQDAEPTSREERKCWPDHPLLPEELK